MKMGIVTKKKEMMKGILITTIMMMTIMTIMIMRIKILENGHPDDVILHPPENLTYKRHPLLTVNKEEKEKMMEKKKKKKKETNYY